MWIIDTDYTEYSLIGDPSRKVSSADIYNYYFRIDHNNSNTLTSPQALWIYGRNPGISHDLYANLTEKASELGFDISKFKMTDQNNNCEYDETVPAGTAVELLESTPGPIQLFQVGGNICEDIEVDLSQEGDLNQVKEWWSGNKYKYTLYSKGLCPKPYTHVDHSEHPIGVSGVTYRELGEVSSAPMQLLQSPEAQMDCSFNDTETETITLTHNQPGNIKIRTCRTGIGCSGAKGQWNSFKDCEYYLGPDQSVDLKFETKVAYFAFFNTKTSESEELWKPKDAPWPTSYTMKV